MQKETNNLEIQEDNAILRLNPSIYPLEIVYNAAYIMIDESFILLDGNPQQEIIVNIRKKRKEQDIQNLVMRFNEELLNYAVYKQQSEKNKALREAILKRVLMTNIAQPTNADPKMPGK